MWGHIPLGLSWHELQLRSLRVVVEAWTPSHTLHPLNLHSPEPPGPRWTPALPGKSP